MSLQISDKASRVGKSRRLVDNEANITIGEVARTYDVSLRTLRFYEDRGLLVPRRDGTARFYAQRDKVKLESILRLKHLGFTLSEIRDLLAETGKRSRPGDVKLRPDQVIAQIAHLERQRVEIEGAIAALRDVQRSLGAP